MTQQGHWLSFTQNQSSKNMQSTRMHLWDILENPESLCEFQWAYRDFHSPAVLDAEKQYADMMYGLNSSQI